MVSKNRVIVVAAAVMLLLVAGFAWWSRGPSSVEGAISLQAQLRSATTDMSKPERNQLLVQLMRTVDEMDREQLRELQEQVRQQQQEALQRSMDEYFQARGPEKQAVLDRAIDRWVAEREVNAALRSNSMRRGGWGGRGGQRDPDGGAENRDARSRPEENAMAAARSAYLSKLRKRAEERGVELGGRRRRG